MKQLRQIYKKIIYKIKESNVRQQLYVLFIALWFLVSTYAWLTSNTFVKVELVDINVETSAGLQISVDAVNWKEVLTREDILTGESWNEHSNHISQNKDMKPVSTVGETTSAGLLRMFFGKVDYDLSSSDLQLALITEELTDDLSTKQYIAFDIFLKSETPANISLDTSSNVISRPDTLGFTKGLENAVRIAFVNQGEVASRVYRTPSGPAYARNLRGAESVTIWEPNSDSHTQASINNTFNAYRTTIGPYDVINSYSGVKGIIQKPILLQNTNHIDIPEYFGEIRAGAGRPAFIQTPKPLRNEAGYGKGQESYYKNTGRR